MASTRKKSKQGAGAGSHSAQEPHRLKKPCTIGSQDFWRKIRSSICEGDGQRPQEGHREVRKGSEVKEPARRFCKGYAATLQHHLQTAEARKSLVSLAAKCRAEDIWKQPSPRKNKSDETLTQPAENQVNQHVRLPEAQRQLIAWGFDRKLSELEQTLPKLVNPQQAPHHLDRQKPVVST